MERILAPRGGGRTYAICEYAVKNNCNILVPMGGTYYVHRTLSRKSQGILIFNIRGIGLIINVL